MITKPYTRDRELLRLISELATALRCWQQDQLFCHGVTFAQFNLLSAVAENEVIRLSDLHGILAVEKSTTTRLLAPLEEKGFLLRERSVLDARAFNVKLTKAGKQMYLKILDFQSEFFDGFEQHIAVERREAIYEAVRLFAENLRNCSSGSCAES